MSSCRFTSDIYVYLYIWSYLELIESIFACTFACYFPDVFLTRASAKLGCPSFASKTFKLMMSCPLAGDSPENHASNSLPLDIYNTCICNTCHPTIPLTRFQMTITESAATSDIWTTIRTPVFWKLLANGSPVSVEEFVERLFQWSGRGTQWPREAWSCCGSLK